MKVISSPTITYADYVGKQKSAIIPAPLDKTVMSKGAWLSVSYTSSIQYMQNGVLTANPDQRLFMADLQIIVLVEITAKNTGTDTAYHVNFTLSVAPGVAIMYSEMPSDINYTSAKDALGNTNLNLNPMISFAAGDSYSMFVYLQIATLYFRRLLASSQSVTFITGLSAAVDLLLTPGADSVTQNIATPLTFSVSTSTRDNVSLSLTPISYGSKPIYQVKATAYPLLTSSGFSVRYLFTRQIGGLVCTDDPNSTSINGKCSSIPTSQTLLNGGVSAINAVADSPIPPTFTGTVTSGIYFYQVSTYDQNMMQLAYANATLQLTNNVIVNPNSNPTPPPSNNTNPVNNQTNPLPSNNTSNSTPDNNTDNNTNNNSDGLLGISAGSSFPLWAMILIPSAVFAVIVVAGVVVCKKYKRIKVYNEDTARPAKQDIESPKMEHPQPEASSQDELPPKWRIFNNKI